MALISSLDSIPEVDTYLRRIGASMRSLWSAVVKENRGQYWKDIVSIRFNRLGDIKLHPEELADRYGPTDDEKKDIKAAITTGGHAFPAQVPIHNLVGDVPAMIKNATREQIFEFRNVRNEIIFVQVRIETPEGKAYIPWTYWSDGQWRNMEPEGDLPLWGMERVKDNTTVFLHEGAKAARAVAEMVEARTPALEAKLAEHPWGQELRNAAHLGWVGGALNPIRTDWKSLRELGVRRVYIVSDNDRPGREAVSEISKRLRIQCWHVQFTDEWPASFDLADQFPAKMFTTVDGVKYYNGPQFRSCLHPATYATQRIVVGKKKVHILNDSFKEIWAYIKGPNVYVCLEKPEERYSGEHFNSVIRPYSQIKDTADLFNSSQSDSNTILAYRPDLKERSITINQQSAINMHIPSDIRSIPGDPKIFLDFITYMFPIESERREILRWCATLIAHPEVRILYGLLLATKNQGIGKTTLATQILAPLVGMHNVSIPTESDIAESQFNSWAANKRLVIVNEIYSGGSWKTYNKIKSMITDDHISVNEKFQRAYTIDNFLHIIACSNADRPIRMASDDRRWYYPVMAETKWPLERFQELRKWLISGGLRVIKHWAEHYGDYIAQGAAAPNTERKSRLISNSRSQAESEVASLGDALANMEEPVVISCYEIEMYARNRNQGYMREKIDELITAMRDVGCRLLPGTYRIRNRRVEVIANRQAWELLTKENDEYAVMPMDDVNKYLRKVSDIFLDEEGM